MAPAQQQADLLVDQDAHPIVNEEVRSQTESQDDAALLVRVEDSFKSPMFAFPSA